MDPCFSDSTTFVHDVSRNGLMELKKINTETEAFYTKPSRLPDFYHQRPQPPGGWQKRNDPDALVESLDKAHDNIKRLIRDNDRMRADTWALIGELKKQRKYVIAAWGAVLTLGGFVLWIAKDLGPYVLKGIANH